MSAQTADYLEAVTHLPQGGKLMLYDVGWDEYEALLAQLADGSHFRITFNEGRLEIMSPSAKHEKQKNFINSMVMILGDELERNVLSLGSVTLKRQSAKKGAEADDCFYIQSWSKVVHKDRIDLSEDPPPDLVVEIDVGSESSGKFAIYAAFGVPEIWHCDGTRWRMLLLSEAGYVHTPRSVVFLA